MSNAQIIRYNVITYITFKNYINFFVHSLTSLLKRFQALSLLEIFVSKLLLI
jgi:hypothetical protein